MSCASGLPAPYTSLLRLSCRGHRVQSPSISRSSSSDSASYIRHHPHLSTTCRRDAGATSHSCRRYELQPSHEEALQLVQPLPPLGVNLSPDFTPNTLNSLSREPLPHLGQHTFSCPRTSFSNLVPHPLHRYSYIGMPTSHVLGELLVRLAARLPALPARVADRDHISE